MIEKVYTCSYCGEPWAESEMDLIEDVCGLCEAHPTHEQDRARRNVNKLAHKGMGLAVDWFEAATVDPYSKATWLLAQHFGRAVSEYREARGELEKEEKLLGGWRNEDE